MSLPAGQQVFDAVEVRFKNSRKEIFRNKEGLTLSIGDVVATQAKSGHDIGTVSLTGELVRIQMKKQKLKADVELPKIYRKATQRILINGTNAGTRRRKSKNVPGKWPLSWGWR